METENQNHLVSLSASVVSSLTEVLILLQQDWKRHLEQESGTTSLWEAAKQILVFSFPH